MPAILAGNWTIPRFIAEAHFTGTTTNSGFVISSPTCVVGDYLLMLLVTNKDTVTPDAAFTQQHNEAGSANPWQTFIYDRVADSTDAAGTTYTWDCSNTTAAPNTAVIMSFRDVDSTNIVIAESRGTTANPVTGPSVTSTRPSLILQGCGTRYASSVDPIRTSTGPGNERHDGGNGTSAPGVKYTGHWYDSGSVSYTIGSNAGGAITMSSATNLTDRASYTISLGARRLNPQSLQANAAQVARNWRSW